MSAISFAEIDTLLIEHRRAEEARNAPAAVAVRALETLREALAAIDTDDEWAQVVAEIQALTDNLIGEAWERMGRRLAAQRGGTGLMADKPWDADRIASVRARYEALDAQLSKLGSLGEVRSREVLVELMGAAKTIPLLLDEVERLRGDIDFDDGIIARLKRESIYDED